ncbi:MAG TPA: hypothetical protein VIC51_10760, partial [Psychromonas sp.]
FKTETIMQTEVNRPLNIMHQLDIKRSGAVNCNPKTAIPYTRFEFMGMVFTGIIPSTDWRYESKFDIFLLEQGSEPTKAYWQTNNLPPRQLEILRATEGPYDILRKEDGVICLFDRGDDYSHKVVVLEDYFEDEDGGELEVYYIKLPFSAYAYRPDCTPV